MASETVSDSVYRQLADSIRRGLYRPGVRLPGERTLAEQLQVSRSTLRVALERLESDKTLSRSAQRGWFVPQPTLGEPPSTLQSFSEMARMRGLNPTAQVLEKKVRTASLDEAEQLGIAPGASVFTLVRLRGMDRTPVCVDSNVLALAVAEPLVDADLTDRSLYEVLEQLCHITIQRSAYSVQAAAASGELAPLLNVTPGSPVLIGREVAYSPEGKPVLLGINTYRGDAYRFEADLYRAIP
ncbi:GntR family transcriptional regulator [Rathayibacter soli]|uniref:GntR family transcriptional regulator n=1 Tax=Rathayibacter soli TaxID=3144168 RepID=UPI0027E46A22|nr:GntR family transcriptional regulator [Glaciibacter superstes]